MWQQWQWQKGGHKSPEKSCGLSLSTESSAQISTSEQEFSDSSSQPKKLSPRK